MSLADHVHQLAREHLKTGPDGKAQYVGANPMTPTARQTISIRA